MDSFEPKKLAIIRILQILETYTDSDHPLTHKAIVDKLYSLYNITVERKAIGRNISLLQSAGYDIETTKKGSYLNSRLFEDAELRLLSDGVLSSRHITAKHSKELIEKLASLSNKHFKSHIKNVYSINDWSKSENAALFYNIEIVDEAIEKGKQISFDYNRYGADKKLHRASKYDCVVSPYQMIVHNQHYFLIARNEYWGDVAFYRLDKITDIKLSNENATPLKNNKGYEKGIDYQKFASALPYMFSDDIESITFYISAEWMIDHVVDWFGYNFQIEQDGDKYKITLKASPCAMEYWAMQYLNYVEILSPASLRKQIAENLQNATQKYSS